jgi:hypothetical protein
MGSLNRKGEVFASRYGKINGMDSGPPPPLYLPSYSNREQIFSQYQSPSRSQYQSYGGITPRVTRFGDFSMSQGYNPYSNQSGNQYQQQSSQAEYYDKRLNDILERINSLNSQLSKLG